MLDQSLNTDSELGSYTGTVDSAEKKLHNATSNVQSAAAKALDTAAERVQSSGKGVSHSVADMADKTASALNTTATYVRDFDSRDMMNDVTDMAKRHPGKSLAIAAAFGFILGRSLMRSSE